MAAPGLVDRYSRSFISSALRKGYELDVICKAADIGENNFLSADYSFGPEELSRISRYIKRLMDDELCGMARRRCRSGTLALATELILNTHSLGEALDKAFRLYAHLNDDIHFNLSIESSFADVRVHLMEPELDVDNHLAEWFMMQWRNWASWLIGEEIPAIRTRFTHARQGEMEEYQQTFMSDCTFKQAENSFTFHQKYLENSIVRDLQDVHKFFATSSIDLVDFSGTNAPLEIRIRSLLKDYLLDAHQFYSMEVVASKFSMSTQSLRRRLEDSGTSFRAIKEEVRKEAAITWLRDEKIPIAEVSSMCGFAEPNGLARAMKSWMGISPTAYREKINNDQ